MQQNFGYTFFSMSKHILFGSFRYVYIENENFKHEATVIPAWRSLFSNISAKFASPLLLTRDMTKQNTKEKQLYESKMASSNIKLGMVVNIVLLEAQMGSVAVINNLHRMYQCTSPPGSNFGLSK